MSLPDRTNAILGTEAAAPAPAISAVVPRASLVLTLVLAIFIAAFGILWPTTASLMERWNDADGKTYTHGYLIVLISAWLLWRNRDRLQEVIAQPFLPALLAMAVTSCMWLLSLRSGIQTGHQVLLPVLIWLAIASALGLRAAWIAAFPVAYLYFSIPVWGGALNGLLQMLTARVVGWMLHVTGVVAAIDGNLIHLPAGTFEIAAGCSGIHFFIVALAIAALYGEIHRDTLKTRVQLLVLAAVLSVATNWIRVYVIVVAGYLTDMQHYLVRVEHYRFGWGVFVVMMVLFMLIARRLPVNAAISSDTRSRHSGEAHRSAILMSAAAAIALLAAGPIWNHIASRRAAELPSEDLLLPIVSSPEWRGPLPSIRFNWSPQFHGADAVAHGRYAGDDHAIQMYSATYTSQRQGKELIAYDNSILGNERTQILSESGSGAWRELEIQSAAGHELIRYRYEIGNTYTSSDLRAQFSYGLHSLVDRPLSRLTALRTDCIPDCEAARKRMTDFAAALNRNDANLLTQGMR